MRQTLLWVGCATLGIVAIGIAIVVLMRNQNTQPDKPTSSLVNQAALRALPHKSASSADTSHLAAGLIPPTNSWMSGMVLQATPQPVYPLPLSFQAADNGFQLGLPSISSSATEINGPYAPGVTVSIAGARSYQLCRYDALSATLCYHAGPQIIGKLTLAEGSPYVFYHAEAANAQLVIRNLNPADVLERTAHYARFRSAGQVYAISSSHATLTLGANQLAAQVPRGDTVALYGLAGASDALRSYAGNAVQSVSLSHQPVGGATHTTLQYHTNNGQPTVVAMLPYQTVPGHPVATYDSVYGPLRALIGNSYTTSVPTVTPQAELNVRKLSADQKQQLIAQLAHDVADTSITQQDSYFAGKQLARAANLLSIAEQLQQTTQVSVLKSKLQQAFAARLTSKYWYYDSKLRGVAATTAGFGSQDFNDHHFHYGYWLYAGSILAHYDAGFTTKYRDQLNLLAADIASPQASSQFPVTRNFDPYTGHSWAAGLAPFADGNNQESSSEAVHAWNGVALWGAATGNQSLGQTGQWMLANEANAAAHAWRLVDTSDPALKNYTSPVVGINFGGKRVYSTFFSDQPNAKLGIQLIPMDPSMQLFAGDKQHIASNVRASTVGNDYNVPLGDYLLMYLALSDPEQARNLAAQQTSIDDGNSKTYLDAWIFTRLNQP